MLPDILLIIKFLKILIYFINIGLLLTNCNYLQIKCFSQPEINIRNCHSIITTEYFGAWFM